MTSQQPLSLTGTLLLRSPTVKKSPFAAESFRSCLAYQMAPKKTDVEDPTWNNCSKIGENRMHLKCNHKPKKHSLEEDDYVNLEDEATQISSKGSITSFLSKGKKRGARQQTMNEVVKKRDPVIREICRSLYKNALPFNLVNCPIFQNSLKMVGEYGRGLKPPTYHEVRVSYLKKEVDHVNTDLENYRKEWRRTGCTIMSDGWSDGKSRHLTNFLVNSPGGTVFLKSVDTSSIIKDGEKLFDLLDEIVDKVGKENEIQVVTDSASAYVRAGKLLMEKRKKLFWSPCAAHLLNLILEDIGEIPIFKNTISNAKEVTKYIYNHTWVLSLFRSFSENKELSRPGVTRFATCFLTLNNFVDRKASLRRMFASKEWDEGLFKNKPIAQKVQAIILFDQKFWKAVMYCLNCVKPLTKVLRFVDGDVKPAMGYIYEVMDKAKKQIAKSLDNHKGRYQKIWDIIDLRWNLQLHRPLHAAAYYLNQMFHYDDKFNADIEVLKGLYLTLDRMFDLETRIKVYGQMDKFHRAQGLFGIPLAVATRDKKQPALVEKAKSFKH